MLAAEGLDPADVATYGYRSERWNFVEGEALNGIVSKLNKDQNRYVINAAASRVVWRTLMFYPGATLVRVTDLSWLPKPITLYFVGVRGQYRRMDGSRRFLSFLNESMPLKISAQNVAEYLRFFCFFVRYRGRPFILVETPDDLGLCEPALLPDQIKKTAPFLKPITITSDKGAEGYELSATVRYHDMLFEANFAVSGKGHVQMLSDNIAGVYLPVPQDAEAAPAWAA